MAELLSGYLGTKWKGRERARLVTLWNIVSGREDADKGHIAFYFKGTRMIKSRFVEYGKKSAYLKVILP